MKKHELGDGPIEPNLREAMNSVMAMLDEFFNPGRMSPDKEVGIVLWLFPYGDRSGRANYISNGANRADMITLMKEQIARFEGQPEIKGES